MCQTVTVGIASEAYLNDRKIIKTLIRSKYSTFSVFLMVQFSRILRTYKLLSTMC